MNTLFNGDYRDIIDKISKDAIVITDPPYNIDYEYNSYRDSLTDDEYINLLKPLRGFKSAIIGYPLQTQKFYTAAFGVALDVGAWCYNGNIQKRFRLINYYGIKPDLSKVKQPYKNPNDKRIKELIANGSEGTGLYEWFNDIQIVKNVSKEKGIHPCPIPEKLAERIILLTTKEGDTVFDPFAGCFTVGIAAKRLNRNYIMCEKDTLYFNYGKERLNTIER